MKNRMMVLMLACLVTACEAITESSSWTCDVQLTLVPSVFGSMRSPSGSGSGTGTGETQEIALREAYRQACSQLPLSNAEVSQCNQGSEFTVEGGGSGNVRLFSAVERSVNCRS